MTAWTIARDPGVVRSITKVRSIFTSSTGSRLR